MSRPGVVVASFTTEVEGLNRALISAEDAENKIEQSLIRAGFEVKFNRGNLLRGVAKSFGDVNLRAGLALRRRAERAYQQSQKLVPVDTGGLKASGKIEDSPSLNPKAKRLQGKSGKFVANVTPQRIELRYGDGLPDARAVYQEVGFVHYRSGKFIQNAYLLPAVQSVGGESGGAQF